MLKFEGGYRIRVEKQSMDGARWSVNGQACMPRTPLRPQHVKRVERLLAQDVEEFCQLGGVSAKRGWGDQDSEGAEIMAQQL